MSVRSSLARLERIAGTLPPPAPPVPPDPEPEKGVRINRALTDMSPDEQYWLYLYLVWREGGERPRYDQPARVNEFLTGLGLEPFDLGGVPTAGGPLPGG